MSDEVLMCTRDRPAAVLDNVDVLSNVGVLDNVNVLDNVVVVAVLNSIAYVLSSSNKLMSAIPHSTI